MAEAVSGVEHGLKRELRLRDLVPMQILLLVGATWSGIAARQGSTHTVLWLAGILFFFLPQAVVVTYCARLWPLEGGIYQWAKFALGPKVAFLSAWNYAIYAILTVSGLGIQVATSLSYALGPRAAWMAESRRLTFSIDALLFGTMLAINVPGMRLGRWVAGFGSGVMGLLVLTLAVLLVWHPGASAAHPHISTQPPFALAWPLLSLLTLNLYVKVAFNAYSGLEQVAVFAGETRDAGRAILLSAWIAAPAVVVIYALMTGSMLTYVPSSRIDLAGPIPQVLAAALGQGIGVWLGRVMILALTLFTICSYTIIMAETSRLPMVAGWDSLLPEWFTRLNARFRTPVRSLCVIVALAALASVLASLDTGREEAFQLLQTSGQLSFGLYYCAMFAVPLFTGSRFGPRPGLWLILCAVSGLVITIVQCVLATVPIVEVASTWTFGAKVAATALATNLIGLAVYWRGRRSVAEIS
ncbi:amino acid permease-associated region [Acidisarcina polymorpha]|uniref:Amino acid permease-associated region n=1 Tax=Acidisarcina polymorpha TaxID=2211140 RepID=A0A2Z5FSE7_9BACT|nr:APC family permease [Acidisarcina polymorpha]AXC09394.1 amino acid permease-associated region [Acidisarcina polymorpha]